MGGGHGVARVCLVGDMNGREEIKEETKSVLLRMGFFYSKPEGRRCE